MRYLGAVGLLLALALVGCVTIPAQVSAAGPKWFECAELQEAETGGFKNETCSEADSTKKSNFERFTIIPAKFSALSHEVKLEASTDVVFCKEDVTSGEIEEPEAAKGVTVKLFGCKGEETSSKKTCEVKSAKPTGGKEEIVLNALKGKLGKVSKAEAASEVGLLLIPESGSAITEIEGSCLTASKITLEGSFISEVTPSGKTVNVGELSAKATEKKQKIQKFEGESQKVITTTILGIKFEVAATDAQKVTFSESAQIGAGEQVQARFVPIFAWQVSGARLVNEERAVQELKATVSGITIEGKVGTTLYRITCTGMAEIGAEKKIIGGAIGTLGSMRTAWEFSGCTMPAPANCAVENQRVLTEELVGFIVQGVSRSSDHILLWFRPAAARAGTFMVPKAINNGGNCSVAGNITINGNVSTQALETAEAFYPEFLFEPRVKTSIQWFEAGRNMRLPAGLLVGSEETTITGITLFAVKEGGGIATFRVF